MLRRQDGDDLAHSGGNNALALLVGERGSARAFALDVGRVLVVAQAQESWLA
jgi:hypothetical protein